MAAKCSRRCTARRRLEKEGVGTTEKATHPREEMLVSMDCGLTVRWGLVGLRRERGPPWASRGQGRHGTLLRRLQAREGVTRAGPFRAEGTSGKRDASRRH